MADETMAAREFLQAKLQASLPGVVVAPFPQVDAFRGVLYKGMANGEDRGPLGGVPLLTEQLWMVVGISPDLREAGAWARVIFVALNRQRGAGEDGEVLWAEREQTVDIPMPGPDGRPRYQMGGMYRLSVQGG